MKNKFKIFVAVIFIFVFVTFYNANIFAASVSISANTSVEIGNNVTINISVPGVTGKCTVTSSNPNVVSLSTSSIWVESGATSPIVGSAKGKGSATITVTPDTMADDKTGDDVSVSAKSITINVKEKYVPPADNNTNNNTNTNTNTNAGTNVNTNTNTNTSNKGNSNNQAAATKSSNAFLSKLQVNVEGLTPNFNKNKYSYTLALNENVDSVNVTATPEDAGAKVTVSGNIDLKEGDNTISVVVTAANGTKKTYTIIATKSADTIKSDSYLANLIIEDCVLSPDFSSEVFEYDLGTVSLDKLNIFAYPKNENAKVEITGNEKLIDGENIVKIKITSEDGTTTKEYTLKLNKVINVVEVDNENVEVNALIDEENMEKTSKWQEIKKILVNNWLVIILFTLVIIEFIEILYLYCKYHGKKFPLFWKKERKETEEVKNDWFKNLNEHNDDFEELDSEEIKVEKAAEKVEEEISVKEENAKEVNEEKVKLEESENEVQDEIVDENQESNEELKDDISYEAIMSKINEIGNDLNSKIDFEEKEENKEIKETKTRNGRKE